MLTLGQTPSIPVVSKVPTIILRMGVLFGFPEQSDVPLIAAMLHSWRQFMKIRDASETSSSYGGMYAPRVISVPQLSKLKDKVSNFILVC
ncbi:Protein argonaute 4 -like protein [Gossypium arboreum]|uniref:Protein argonaute 4-like protein n=1 Tax=Gossypium arboreum TaxID=29729 RepID=A0A0B0PJM9_GOSAR|nr:Protein argonaute 4 -like protein [Gossypium arboreum]